PGPRLLLVHRVANPRRLGEECLHEVGILFERAFQGRRPLPLLEHPGDSRIARGQVPGERVGVQSREERLGALVGLLRDRGEREDRVPRRVRHGLHDERLALDRGARARGQA
ncbi:MAG: hypothetical protein ACK56I_00915, partial [bacterium]